MNRTLRVLEFTYIVFIVFILIPFSPPFKDQDYSLVVKDEKGKMLRAFINKDEQWCFPIEEDIEIPEKLATTVTFYEDKYFKWHFGINPVSIFRAAFQNIKNNEVISGASTITMQLCRIDRPQARTFINKMKEIQRAIKIDFYYSKRKILNLYLHHAPYGGNIIGYKAASLKYFDKQASDLSWAEAATLAVLPNAPGLASPQTDSELLKTKRNNLLRRLWNKNIIDKSTYQLAILEEIPSNVYVFETTAAHLTQRIYSNHREKLIYTTIDYDIQKHIETIVRIHSSYLQQQGIQNASVLVLENDSLKVKAYVGSQDFFDKNHSGQVDGIISSRSSGSILKPFLYALSMDEGLIIPLTLIKDVPSYFNAFSPSNADKKFNGIVSAHDALIRSLNIPAVRLLNAYGVYSFYNFLSKSGVSTLFRTPDDYGLPLIIGGAEVTPWDMATLYCGLSNGGNFKTPTYLKGSKSLSISEKNISPAACYLTLDILKDVKRPGVEYYWQEYQNQKPLAWKTGTSYGHKDAWAIGTSPKWTIVVWVGNFNGEGTPNLAGAKSAGPLLFEIWNNLPGSADNNWYEKIEMDYKTSKICKETGFLASPACPNNELVDVPMNMKSLKLCPYHKRIFVDKNGQYEVCSFCWEDGYKKDKLLIYPVEVNYELSKRGYLIKDKIPEHNPNCKKGASSNPLQIIYPKDSTMIWLPRDFGGVSQKIVAKIAHNNSSKTIYWYLDDEYLGTTNNIHEMAFSISKGWHDLIANDEDGHKSSVRFKATLK